MKAPAFLAMLRDRDIQVWAEGDRLRCNAPAGALTPELREELRLRKDEVLGFLRSAGSLARQQRAIVPLQPRGTRIPVFAFGGHNGDVFCFRALAKHLGADQPFFGLQPPGWDGASEPLTRIEDLAAYFAAEIRAYRPEGPYAIAGFCAGGTIAFELARQLVREKAGITLLALFGAPYPTSYRRVPRFRRSLGIVLERLRNHARVFASLPAGEKLAYVAERLRNSKSRLLRTRSSPSDPVLVQRAKVGDATLAGLRRYTPGYYDGSLTLYLSCQAWTRSVEAPLRWRSAARHVEEYYGPDDCNGDIMLLEPHVARFAELFRQCAAKHGQQGSLKGSSTPRPAVARILPVGTVRAHPFGRSI